MRTSHNGNKGVQENKPIGFGYKILRIFADVRPGEATKVLLLAFNIFLILAAYYMIKIVRDSAILEEHDARTKNILSAVLVILLIFIVKAFSFLASKVPRQKLITWVTLFFISNLGLFYILLFLIKVPSGTISIIYFVWVGIFNLMVIAQFWGFANDLYTKEEGKRLFPIIAFGGTFGAYIGSKMANWIITPVFVYQMMLISGAILGICILLTFIVHNREIKKVKDNTAKEIKKSSIKDQEKPLEKVGGFKLVFKSRYLFYIALFVFSLNLVNTTGEFILDTVFERSADEAVQIGRIAETETLGYLAKLKANFFELVNLLAMLIQLLIVSRIFKWFGVRFALFVLPFISLGGNIFMSLGASLLIVRWSKAFENSTDYSLTNTTRNALYLITSREEKYKAKAAIHAFFTRAGDLGSTLIVVLGTTTYLSFTVESFAKFNIMVAVLWIIMCVLIAREHKKVSKSKNIVNNGL